MTAAIMVGLSIDIVKSVI